MYRGEWFNSLTHLFGAVAGLIGLIVLVVVSVQSGDPWKIVSFSVYGATLLFLYAASTLYHSTKGRAKDFFQLLDHHGIYLLIAGTYTPFALVSLRDSWGWAIFTVVWLLAAVGMVLDTVQRGGRRILPLIIYLVMGWLIVLVLKPLLHELNTGGFVMLLLGGLFYTGGVVFYVLDHKVSYFHGIWHLFVLAGSIMHYFTVMYFVA